MRDKEILKKIDSSSVPFYLSSARACLRKTVCLHEHFLALQAGPSHLSYKSVIEMSIHGTGCVLNWSSRKINVRGFFSITGFKKPFFFLVFRLYKLVSQ